MNKRVNGNLVERVERLERDSEEMRAELRRLKVHAVDIQPFEAQPTAPPEEKIRHRLTLSVAHPMEISRKGRGEEIGRDAGSGESSSSGWLPFDLGDLGDYRSGEWWLGKIGVGLLLFGVAFLYLLSVERGWITPPVRVAFGLVLGVILLTLGLRVFEHRRSFSQVLLGGGVGTLYATGFAVLNLYALVPHALAFSFMVAVTLLAFFLSLRGSGAALALVGTVGGLGTPFILHDGSSSIGGLVLYTCVILAGTGAIYLYKDWPSLLAVSFFGGWSVLLVGLLTSPSTIGGRYPEDATALQLGVAFAWLLFWLVPALREALCTHSNPVDLRAPTSVTLGGATLTQATSFSSPLLALAFTQMVWTLSGEILGFVALAAAALYALAALALRRLEGTHSQASSVSFTQALVALLFLTLAIVLVLDGDALLFALAAEAAVVCLAARRLLNRVLAFEAHFLWVVVAIWLCVRLLIGVSTSLYALPFAEPPFGAASLTDLAVIVLAFLSSQAVSPRTADLYRAVAHAAVLAWLARELLPLPDGETWTLLSWTLYAAILHLISHRLPSWDTGTVAHAVSAAVAVWLAARLFGLAVAPGYPGTPVFNTWGLADLAVIALLAVVGLLPGAVAPHWITQAYAVTCHVAVLAYLSRELSMPPGGEAFVTLAWGAYAVALLVAGIRLDRVPIFRCGMITLFLLVGKLFLLDLASIEAFWRVLLFLGFGALFLALSFYTRSLWRPNRNTATTKVSH